MIQLEEKEADYFDGFKDPEVPQQLDFRRE
jgi:hypothetical protein